LSERCEFRPARLWGREALQCFHQPKILITTCLVSVWTCSSRQLGASCAPARQSRDVTSNDHCRYHEWLSRPQRAGKWTRPLVSSREASVSLRSRCRAKLCCTPLNTPITLCYAENRSDSTLHLTEAQSLPHGRGRSERSSSQRLLRAQSATQATIPRHLTLAEARSGFPRKGSRLCRAAVVQTLCCKSCQSPQLILTI